jgi:mono/diheme cytochrome c family protein
MNVTSVWFLICLASAAGLSASARGGPSNDLTDALSPAIVRLGGGAIFTELRFVRGAPAADGSYTVSQAERGKVVYEQSCSTCHGASLRGGANEFAAPALAGPFFYEKWSGRPLEELFRYTVENMPPDQTRLSEAAYLDVTAYILQVWKYPAGNTDLSADSAAMKRKIDRPQ